MADKSKVKAEPEIEEDEFGEDPDFSEVEPADEDDTAPEKGFPAPPTEISPRAELAMTVDRSSFSVVASEDFALAVMAEFIQFMSPPVRVNIAELQTEGDTPTEPAVAAVVGEAAPEPPKPVIDDSEEWTAKDDRNLTIWRGQDHPFERIAEHMGRSEDAVSKRYRLLQQREREADGRE